MNIKIVCVGKLKEKYFKDGIAEYVKRMGRFAKIKIVQVPAEKDFPKELKDYISFIEKEMKRPITIVSVGPDREATIIR